MSPPYIITQSDFTNPGKGSAFVKVKFKNLESGSMLERTYKTGVETGVKQPDIEEKEVEYMYSDMEGFHFMDQATFETITLREDQIGDSKLYLQESIKLDLLYFNARPISIELPNFVSLQVTQTDPGLKGDTASGGLKKAIMETGLQLNVPLFIKEGELLKVDTRTGDYVERVKS